MTVKNHLVQTSSGQIERELDAMKRDRFELLSAYLDGELTADERRQVNCWLADDPNVQCLYQRLLHLRRGMQQLPVPAPDMPVDATIEAVFARLKRRFRIALMAGAGTLAVVCVATMSGFFDERPGIFQLARLQPGETESSAVLEVALDEPVIEIPKAAITPITLGEETGIQ